MRVKPTRTHNRLLHRTKPDYRVRNEHYIHTTPTPRQTERHHLNGDGHVYEIPGAYNGRISSGHSSVRLLDATDDAVGNRPHVLHFADSTDGVLGDGNGNRRGRVIRTSHLCITSLEPV